MSAIAPQHLLQQMFTAAVSAARPDQQIQRYLPSPPRGRTVVVGMGKSAAAMAQAVEAVWEGRLSGLVVTPYGHSLPTRWIEVVEAAHPIPDLAGVTVTQRIFDWMAPLTANDLVICLISGGGSALFTWPPAGISLSELADIHQQLLNSGADIAQINTVRKNLSRSSGGRLAAAAYPAPVISLIISDVPGDQVSAIASGPTLGDTVTAQDALAILQRYRISVSEAIQAHLSRDPYPVIAPNDPRLQKAQHRLIATPQQSLTAAAAVATAHGYQPLILGSALEGEAREVGRVHGGIARQVVNYHQPVTPPCVLLSGGETTVTLTKTGGKGGRNGEFLLSLAIALQGLPGVFAIAADTDGIDGTEDNAGALITPDILSQAQQQGLSAGDYLANHDSYTFFSRLNALITTGPTLTNVNDFRGIAIAPP